MDASSSLAGVIDAENLAFTSHVKSKLSNLANFDTRSLNWLMLEHYQFSARNTTFLAQGAELALEFTNAAIHTELMRNLAEENGHAAMYKSALERIGISIESRDEFPPTSYFFFRIAGLISDDPSRMLGAMYATEAAAIFEHEIFRHISKEVIRRGELAAEGKPLVAFHDMHLSGVEQSHKDELGIFLQEINPYQQTVSADGVSPGAALDGGRKAIAAMRQWWQDLLAPIFPLAIAA
ncbi:MULTISPECIES: DUF3865 domain-containing protein [Sphingomonadaceae]|uniref:DUF3865 domain-containing protein n=1 Tax=Sphingomonadales TaxID=204457 RepID=UPI00076FE4FE|nr:DUF3865 domain-containing protein [Sphingobium sp. TKS]AMK23034.1 hypothetical protein K426_10460 [Sphingobium sp. TKS]MCF8707853.1 DUF3865 domain-containing protein [Rhizorhapis sp. SPR117]